MDYKKLCFEQSEIIEQLVSQNKRLISALDQFVSVEAEEKFLSNIEKKIQP